MTLTPHHSDLSFEAVSRSFNGKAAVKDVTFALRRGEILTLLGPSGCGKTTTLRMAIGLERATSGRVVYDGRVVDCTAEKTYVPPQNRDMGMVFQSYAIWPHMTVFENVAFPLRLRKLGNLQVTEKVSEILKIVGLSGLEQSSGMQLSGGQQQRIAIARGLVYGPRVLLMDEPFSNLDAKLRDQMRVDLKTLQRRLGISILFVTHDQTEALALSDRIAVMRAGTIEQIGSPVELYTKPASAFVRDFLGRSMLLPGQRIAVPEGQTPKVRLETGQILDIGGIDHTQSNLPGAHCLVSIRLEEIITVPAGEGDARPNEIDATIRTLLFLGQVYEAVVTLPGNADALITMPRVAQWQEGQAICLRLPPASLQLWDID